MPYTVAYKIGLSCDYDGTFQFSSKKIVWEFYRILFREFYLKNNVSYYMYVLV